MAACEVRFYHLKRWPLETALPRLLAQAYGRGVKTVVRVGSEQRLAALNAVLWTYDPGSFLAHGGPDDGNGAEQPIYLTTGNETPNGAELLVLVDGAVAENLEAFARCCEMFDDTPQQVAAARARWKALAATGHPVTYWQQSEDGRWQQKA